MSKQNLHKKKDADSSDQKLDGTFSSDSRAAHLEKKQEQELRPRAPIPGKSKTSISDGLKSTRLRYENDVILNDGISGTSSMRSDLQRSIAKGSGGSEFETRREDIELEIAAGHDGRRKGRRKSRKESRKRFSTTEQVGRLNSELDHELDIERSELHATPDAARTSVALSPELSHALQKDLQRLEQFARQRGDADARPGEHEVDLNKLEQQTDQLIDSIFSKYSDDPYLESRVTAVLNGRLRRPICSNYSE